MLTILCRRKFFGKPNGTKPPKPQQSTLAFKKKDDKASDTVKEEDNDDGPEANGKVEPDVKEEDVAMEDEDDVKVKAEPKASQSISPDTSAPKRVKQEEDDDEQSPPKKKPRKASPVKAQRKRAVVKDEEDAEEDEDPVPTKSRKSHAVQSPPKEASVEPEEEAEEEESEEEEKPEVAAKRREKVQTTLKASGKDPYPDWKAGDPVPFAALCTSFSKIEMTTKRLEILAHCSLFLRQVMRLTPNDLLPTVMLMVNKLAADYAGIELGIGESLIMKAIGESSGRTVQAVKADQTKIGDLGLVAAKSKSNQKQMWKPKPLTVRGVHENLMKIATTEGQGAQGRKVDGIKKLLGAADADKAGKVDITKDKGGPSEAKYIVRMLEGKLRLGLAEKTVLVAVAQAVVFHETAQKGNKVPSTDQLAKGESILKSVYR